MKILTLTLSGLSVLTVLFSSCSEGRSYREPDECITGYGLQSDYNKWIATDLAGNQLFADKMITTDEGEQFGGDRLSWKSQVSCGVNGFFRTGGSYSGYSLVADKLTDDGRLKTLGSYESVGMFYEDVTPAAKKGEGIGYINRDGDVVFWLDKVLGKKGRHAYNFMGGLSVVGTPITDDGVLIYGAIDTEGNIVLPFDYFKLQYAGSGLWYAENAGKNSGKDYDDWEADIIDRNGKAIISFPRRAYHRGTFSDDNGNHGPHQFAFSGEYGLLYALYDSDWKIIDRSGKVLAENIPGISPTGEHRHDKFIFKDDESRLYGIMNQNGEIEIEAQFSSIGLLDDQLFYARKDGEYSIYHYSGDCKYRWSNDHVPRIMHDDYLVETRQGATMFYPIDDILNEKQIDTGRYGGEISHYDNLLLEPIWSQTKEMWMPDIEKRETESATPIQKKITDKPVADVIGPVKKVVYYDNGYKSDSYEFDENGRLTRMGDIVLTDENTTRDGQDRLTSVTVKEESALDGIVEITTSFEYDENGRLKAKSQSSEYDVWTLTYIRNDSGVITGTKTESEGGGSNEDTYKYADFDTKHNWTKRTSADSYGNKTVTTRKITYHK